MATKAYLMITVNNEFCKNSCQAILSDLFTMPDIDFIEKMEGTCDLLVRSKFPTRIQLLAEEILAKEWCQNLRLIKTQTVELRENSRLTTLKIVKDYLARHKLLVTA